MDFLVPQTYLIGLIGLLSIVAILVARQVFRVRKDEIKLISLEKDNAGSSKEAARLYELASVQLRKRLYPQAITTLKKAVSNLSEEPDEARALIENALGFALAAEDNFNSAIKHYELAIKAKSNYPVALNNLAYANLKLKKYQESSKLYNKVLELDPGNKTAKKQLNRLIKENISLQDDNEKDKGFLND